MRLAIALSAVLLLAGCVSPEVRAQREAAMRAAIDAADNDRCVSFGAERGTPTYTDCRMKLLQMRVSMAEAAQDRMARADAVRELEQQVRANAPPLQMSHSTQCTTNAI